jgi:hypothetical protein
MVETLDAPGNEPAAVEAPLERPAAPAPTVEPPLERPTAAVSHFLVDTAEGAALFFNASIVEARADAAERRLLAAEAATDKPPHSGQGS